MKGYPASPLRVLVVEDREADDESIAHNLRTLDRPVELQRVSTARDLRARLSTFEPDVVLSDCSMPDFSGKQALRIVHGMKPDVPVILVSGGATAMDDEPHEHGRVEYVTRENLGRLSAAIDQIVALAGRHRELDRSESALRESEARFRAIVESTGDWVWEIDRKYRLCYSNASIERLLGRTPDEVIDRPLGDLVHADDWPARRLRMDQSLDARTGWRQVLTRFVHADGSLRWLESNAAPRVDVNGAIAGFRGVDRDVTQRIEHETKIQQLVRFHALLSGLGEALLHSTDVPSLLMLTCRLAVEQGKFQAALVGALDANGHLRTCASAGDAAIIAMVDQLGPGDLTSEVDRLRPSVRVFVTGEKEISVSHADARVTPALRERMRALGIGAQVILPIGQPPWAVLGLCATQAQAFDEAEVRILERVAAQIDYARSAIAKSERLAYLAHHDAISGLPNRASFIAHARPLLEAGPMFVGALNVMEFRSLHDVRGRPFAEAVVGAIGHRICECLEDAAQVAHLGGEYFLIAGPASDSLEPTRRRLEGLLLECAAEPIRIGDESIYFSLRGGLSMAPDHGVDLDVLERNALSALVNPQSDEVTLQAFDEEMRQRAERRVQIERDLRVATAGQHFELHLQPVFDCASRQLRGAEALMRWRHPELGMVSPAEFVPLLESTGLIAAAGAWAMKTVFDLLTRWRELGHRELRIAVNVSAREFRQPGFVSRCRTIFGGESAGVDIEVTESIVMHDIERTITILDGLRQLGCRVAIDDFGAGYSSLNYLARLPADVLKIDRSFVTDIDNNAETLSLVTNVIGLAHSLNLQVVAEGVETESQEKLLRLLRCDVLQGNRLGRALPIDEFESLYLS